MGRPVLFFQGRCYIQDHQLCQLDANKSTPDWGLDAHPDGFYHKHSHCGGFRCQPTWDINVRQLRYLWLSCMQYRLPTCLLFCNRPGWVSETYWSMFPPPRVHHGRNHQDVFSGSSEMDLSGPFQEDRDIESFPPLGPLAVSTRWDNTLDLLYHISL